MKKHLPKGFAWLLLLGVLCLGATSVHHVLRMQGWSLNSPSAGQAVAFHDATTLTNLTISGGSGLTTNANQFLGVPLSIKDGAVMTNVVAYDIYTAGTNHGALNLTNAAGVRKAGLTSSNDGELFLSGGAGAGKVLTSDANGVGTWGTNIIIKAATGISLHTNGVTITVSNSSPSSVTNYVRPVFQSAAATSTDGATETMIYSNNLPANTVFPDEAQLVIRFLWEKIGTTGTGARIRFYFGDTMYYDSGVAATNLAGFGALHTTIPRLSSGTQAIICEMSARTEMGWIMTGGNSASGLGWNTDIPIWVTAQVTSGDSLVGRGWWGGVYPAAQ